MKGTRVLVVEDSPTIRGYIADLLRAAPGFELAGEARNGEEAVEMCERLRPDVVTMDMMMPVMTGLAATEHIMAHCPTPILIVSASTNRGELFKTYDALAAGAVDVIEKPLGGSDEYWERQLIGALRIVSRVRVITHPRAKLGRRESSRGTPAAAGVPRVIAMGASTGGPGAVLAILRSLPADFPAPILLVIHIAEPFGLAMAEWLDAECALTVRYAVDGERLPGRGEGCVLLASPDRHLELNRSRLHLTTAPERHACRPSVDVLFESLARHEGGRTLACLLTGMGRDGAQGLLGVRRAGGVTLAQDESTCVVFGMPGEAVRLGAATHVLPLNEIPRFLLRACKMTQSIGRSDR